MGIIQCDIHGSRGIATVSEAIARAVDDNERWSSSDVVKVLYESPICDFPLHRTWLARRDHGDLDGKVLPFDEVGELAHSPVCYGCLHDWLRSIGVEVRLSPEEERFVHLRERLFELLKPHTEGALDQLRRFLFDRTRQPTGSGFDSQRTLPLVIYVRTEEDGSLRIEIEDHQDYLEGRAHTSLAESARFSSLAEVRIPLAGGRLDPAGEQAVEAWGALLKEYLEACLGSLQEG